MPSLNTKLASAPNTQTNYVLKATSSTTIGNSLIQDDGTNVAIGTTPATYKLNVNGTLGVTGAATFSSSVTATKVILSGGSDQSELTNPVNNDFKLTNSGNFRIVNNLNNIAILTVKNNGSIGIGESPINGKLEIQQTATSAALWVQTGGTTSSYTIADFRTGTNLSALQILGNGVSSFGGNVGIGTSSPNAPLEILGTGAGTIVTQLNLHNGSSVDGSGARLNFTALSDNSTSTGAILNVRDSSGAYSLRFHTYGGGGNDERMRITSGGQVVVNATSSIPNAYISAVANSNQPYPLGAKAIDSSQGLIGFFDGSNNIIGNVFRSNSSVQYNTSSDYRLKEDLKDLNGLDKVLSIKVYDFKWKNYESRTDGVMAHELAEILPYAVNGIKDAVDEDGNIIPQGVDYSKIVPVLVKAIQELNQNIQNQQEQINQLINK